MDRHDNKITLAFGFSFQFGLTGCAEVPVKSDSDKVKEFRTWCKLRRHLKKLILEWHEHAPEVEGTLNLLLSTE